MDFPSGQLTMIDIDNSRVHDDEEVLTDPIEYFQRNFKDRSIFRFVLTHPDMDHMSGLDELVAKVSIINFWDTDHSKVINPKDWEGSPYNPKDWEQYLRLRQSSEMPKCLKLRRNETSECCWVQDGIKILSPSTNLIKLSTDAPDNDPQKYHHLSYVLKVEYAGVKILLGGDASPEAWEDMLNEYRPETLKSNIFLAPHHGSKENIHKKAFEAIDPDFVIVSIARGVEYDYAFYKQLAKQQVLSTKANGTIRVEVKENGQYLPIFIEKNP